MPVYLDHAATTPLRPEVLDAMTPLLGGVFGNPSSPHAFGRIAREALDDAHERLAGTIGGEAREIVFTSGGTEANNLALKGAAWAGKSRGHRIVTTSVEHHAVGHALAYLEHFGFEVAQVPVDRYGRVAADDIEAAITDRTTLVSVMLANNEVGTLQPIAEIAAVVRAHRGILLHVDAVQAAPWVDLDVVDAGRRPRRAVRAQGRGPEGVRGAVDPARHAPARTGARRHAGAAPAGRDGERCRRRRDGVRIRARRGRAADHRRARAGAARPPARGAP